MSTATLDKKTASASPRNKKRALFGRLLLLFFSTLFAMALAEGFLRFVEKKNATHLVDFERLGVKDPLLSIKLPPNYPGHDANGFRNKSIPSKYDIIAIGDSQTWGINASLQEAWPKQLEKRAGREVYSMSLGGYGPIQYAVLCGQAVKLKPKVILVGLYLGNDIWDTYSLAYTMPAHARLANEALRPRVMPDTILPRTKQLWDEEKNFLNQYGRGSLSEMPTWLRGHTAIGRLIDKKGLWPGGRGAFFVAGKEWARQNPSHGVAYDHGGVQTILTTAYRLESMNREDPRVQEGMRIIKRLLEEMKGTAESHGAKLLVVLIPTKELVYSDAVKQQEGKLEPTYEKCVHMETLNRNEILDFCKSRKIETADALTGLQRSVASNESIYPPDTESHPNPHGYDVIATAAQKRLTELRW